MTFKKVTIARREIDAAIAHASTDPTRANLCSVHVSRNDEWTRIESTDGSRLIRIQRQEDGPAEYCELLNIQDLKTASKLISGAAANPNSRDVNKHRSFALSPKDKQEKVEAEVKSPYDDDMLPEATATLRTVAGQFPNTDQVLPDVAAKVNDYIRVSVNPEFLIDAAKALKAVCSTERFGRVQLHIRKEDAENHPMLITGEHHENGTRGVVLIMPVRQEGITGAPYPERETENEA